MNREFRAGDGGFGEINAFACGILCGAVLGAAWHSLRPEVRCGHPPADVEFGPASQAPGSRRLRATRPMRSAM